MPSRANPSPNPPPPPPPPTKLASSNPVNRPRPPPPPPRCLAPPPPPPPPPPPNPHLLLRIDQTIACASGSVPVKEAAATRGDRAETPDAGYTSSSSSMADSTSHRPNTAGRSVTAVGACKDGPTVAAEKNRFSQTSGAGGGRICHTPWPTDTTTACLVPRHQIFIHRVNHFQE